ncbi:MAG: site-specific DNA-methyltransferase [Sulfolobus sp.]|nr:site-specific DNA-methyltransferase [Sulfolobus sp.]
MSLIKVIFGDSSDMHEIENESVSLVLTSPPYYNAPFDFPGFFKSYDDYLDLLKRVGKEIYRVLHKGRNAVFVTMDMRVDGVLYPITADLIKTMQSLGFQYQERIIWKKPEAYVRISGRSGILIQHPYPMYYYPDNIFEDIVVFRKPGEPVRKKDERSKIDVNRFQKEKWYLNIWEITNVVPQIWWSKYTAPFPDELAERIISLYSYVGETVLDPFLGSGTTCVVAMSLNRNCIGYEIDIELKEVIKKRLHADVQRLTQSDTITFTERADAKHIRSQLEQKINENLQKKSVSRNKQENNS